MLILGGFLKPFTVCITIKTIPTFPILNYFPLLFRILFSSFFFLLLDASIPHIFFSDYECECISLYVHSLIIYFLFSDTPDTDFFQLIAVQGLCKVEGAMSFLIIKVYPSMIILVARWKSDTMLRYLKKKLQILSCRASPPR